MIMIEGEAEISRLLQNKTNWNDLTERQQKLFTEVISKVCEKYNIGCEILDDDNIKITMDKYGTQKIFNKEKLK
jgi:hypothetical protein